MRSGVAWVGAKAELFDEAMRLVPAVAGHRARGDKLLVNATLTAFQREACDKGVNPLEAWSILTSAYMVWAQNLFELQADSSDISIETMIEQAVGAAADWVATP